MMKTIELCKRITKKVVLLVLMISTPVMAEDEAAARAILDSMSAEIASLDKFAITGEAYADARLKSGQLIEHSSDVVMRFIRPNKLRVTNRSAESTGEIFFSEGMLSVYNGNSNYYAQTPIPAGLNAAVFFAVDEVGVEAPILDFISSDVVSYLTEDADSVDYIGLSRFRGQSHHHIGIRTSEIDIQLWVLAEGTPLPAKMALSAKWEGGSPRSVFFFSWDTDPKIKSKTLRFEPPPGAIKIEFDRGVEQ
jgi:hypothetical protein